MFGNVFEYQVLGIMCLKTSILIMFLGQKRPEINVIINESLLCVLWSLYMKLCPL